MSRLLGGPAMAARIRKIAKQFPDRVAAALYQEAQIEMTEAKRRTPVDTGALRASGHVDQPQRGRGRQIYVVLSFGTMYAIYVHENLDAFHAVGQAKYLESVLNESRSHMAERLAKRIDLNKERDASA